MNDTNQIDTGPDEAPDAEGPAVPVEGPPAGTSGRRLAGRCAVICAVLALTFASGYAVRWAVGLGQHPGQHAAASQPSTSQPAARGIWTCSMHPEVRQDEPGMCPVCEMPLVRATPGGGDPNAATLVLSPAAREMMEIETTLVERKFVSRTVRMVGKVDYDETRLKHITAWVPGRLDRLFVDYTGLPVRKGDHMVELYSGELLSAQEELLGAAAAVNKLSAAAPQMLRDSAAANLEAARERLRRWGLTPEQVEAIEKSGKATDRITIYAPTGGVVIARHLQQGAYVKTGSRIYTIGDLTHLWVRLDAYESDLAWLTYRQDVTFTTLAHPGREFAGTVAFISPTLDEATRTVKVRVNADNTDATLKPGMFVRASVSAMLDESGHVVAPLLKGKWVCPMHPSVIKDSADATCDICGMALVSVESQGLAGVSPDKAVAPLVVPVSAVLKTGRRAVVYVQRQGADKPTFDGRWIVLGPRAGEYYVVRDGLMAGERVVTRGNFLIDSALQVSRKPSMMTPGKARRPAGNEVARSESVSAEFSRQLAAVFDAYFEVHGALAASKPAEAAAAAGRMTAALEAVDMMRVTGKDHAFWTARSKALAGELSPMAKGRDLASVRKSFSAVSRTMIALARRFGLVDRKVYRVRCPMAFDNAGADWLQLDTAVSNPYEAETMPRCGSVLETIAPAGSAPAKPAPGKGGQGDDSTHKHGGGGER